jgi:hypothetical protein
VSSRAKKPPCSRPSPRGTFGNSPLSWDVWPCRYVYGELLGMSAQEIKALAEEALIGTMPPPGQRPDDAHAAPGHKMVRARPIQCCGRLAGLLK